MSNSENLGHELARNKTDDLHLGEIFDVNIFSDAWYTFECTQVIDLKDSALGSIRKASFLDIKRGSQFSETNRNLTESFGKTRFVQERLRRAGNNQTLINKLNEILNTGGLSPLRIDELDSPILYHGTGFMHKSRGFFSKQKINLETMRKTGMYGSSRRVTYVTKDFERAVAHSPRSIGADILLLVIDTNTLMNYRSIFPDPESLSMRDEFMKNFVVPFGIPNASIYRAYRLTCKGERK